MAQETISAILLFEIWNVDGVFCFSLFWDNLCRHLGKVLQYLNAVNVEFGLTCWLSVFNALSAGYML